MTSYAAKLVAKRFFKENVANQNGHEVCYLPFSAVVITDRYFLGSLLRDCPGDQTRRALQDHQEEAQGSATGPDT